jgi:hypothetical protein
MHAHYVAVVLIVSAPPPPFAVIAEHAWQTGTIKSKSRVYFCLKYLGMVTPQSIQIAPPPFGSNGGETLASGGGGGGTQFRRSGRHSGTLCIL